MWIQTNKPLGAGLPELNRQHPAAVAGTEVVRAPLLLNPSRVTAQRSGEEVSWPQLGEAGPSMRQRGRGLNLWDQHQQESHGPLAALEWALGKLGFRELVIISSSGADMKTKARMTLWNYEEEEEALVPLGCLKSSGFRAGNLHSRWECLSSMQEGPSRERGMVSEASNAST